MQIKNDDLGLYGKLTYEEREKLSMNANGDCVIDFKAFAKDHGIDLNDWRFDVHAMSVVPANEASPSATPENDVIAGFVHHSAYVPSMVDGEINGKDIVNSVIVPIFNEAGKAEVAQQLIDDPWKVLGVTEKGEHRYLNVRQGLHERFG